MSSARGLPHLNSGKRKERMRAVVIPAVGKIRFETVDLRGPGPGEVLIRVSACGLCTTDLDILDGRFWGAYPMVPGHEISGAIAAVGSDVEDVEPGDLVTVDPNIACGSCAPCASGAPHLCTDLRAIGVTEPGGFAEYVLAPGANVYRLPSEMDPECGALAEPVACVLHGLDRANVSQEDVVAVHGIGFIGLTFALVMRHLGIPRLILIDPLEGRRDAARSLGFEETLDPCDAARELSSGFFARPSVSIDCSGAREAVETALETARSGGRILLFGVADPAERVEISPYDLFRREITILGSFVNPFTHPRAVDLLSKLDLERLITHRFDLASFAEAVDLRRKDPSALKILIKPLPGEV